MTRSKRDDINYNLVVVGVVILSTIYGYIYVFDDFNEFEHFGQSNTHSNTQQIVVLRKIEIYKNLES